ncbi:MAG: mandelate racemase/muconate lactonizing enzyme family protein [Bacteroidetes bacterium]|nr:mandelate racemase/muconate lactonizing enzyme family protein [Bacteroidota bacterium]
MRLESLETFIVGTPPPGFGGRYFIFVRLRTSCGITGIGEIYSASFAPKTVVKMAEDMFARYLEGEPADRIEHFWRRAHGSGFTHRPDTSVQGVVSGLEMACWDIVGKALDRPVYALLGGLVNPRLRTYTYLYPSAGQDAANFYNDPIASAETAAACVAEGFTGVKFDPAGQYTVYDPRMPDLEALERSEAFCREIRAAIGQKADMLFGTHGQFTAAGALRMAKRLEPYDPLWFEEPCPPDMPEEMARVAADTTIPIATGERLCSKFEFARVMDLNAAAILQPNLGRAGGILEAKKIAAIAETRYVQIAPHLYCGPVVAAANIQLAACIPNFLILESIGKMDGFHAKLLKTPLEWEDGYLIPPTAPGLGVELDDDVVAAHPWTGTGLHLDMGAAPHDPRQSGLFGGG